MRAVDDLRFLWLMEDGQWVGPVGLSERWTLAYGADHELPLHDVKWRLDKLAKEGLVVAGDSGVKWRISDKGKELMGF